MIIIKFMLFVGFWVGTFVSWSIAGFIGFLVFFGVFIVVPSIVYATYKHLIGEELY